MGEWIWTAQAIGSGLSLAVGRPWTAYLAARRYEPQVREHPWFREANVLITRGWTAYFAMAAVASFLAAEWVGLALIVPTPFLAVASFRIGDAYAARKGRLAAAPGEASTRTAAQEEVRALVTGLDDTAVLAAAAERYGSIEALLDSTIDGMPAALDPSVAEDCVIGYEIGTPNGLRAYRVEVQGARVDTAVAPPTDARVVLTLDAPDYLRLISGLLDGTEAFMSGRMKISGDVMFAPRIAPMFRATATRSPA